MKSPSVKRNFLISEKITVLETNSCYQDRILKTDVWQHPLDCTIASLKKFEVCQSLAPHLHTLKIRCYDFL